MNILFVCTGNLNRSPAAHTIMKKLSPKDNVDSAATRNKKSQITPKNMREALRRAGYNYKDIHSKPVTKRLIDWADVVLYMQPSHLVSLTNIVKSNKYINLAKYIHKTKIQDPHENPMVYDRVVKDIEMALKNFIRSRKT